MFENMVPVKIIVGKLCMVTLVRKNGIILRMAKAKMMTRSVKTVQVLISEKKIVNTLVKEERYVYLFLLKIVRKARMSYDTI